MTTVIYKGNYGCGSAPGSGFSIFSDFTGNGGGDYEQGGGNRYFAGHGVGYESNSGQGSTDFCGEASGWARGGGNEIMDGVCDLMGWNDFEGMDHQ